MSRVVLRDDAPVAGWYPDPDQPARLRWWDGTDWADHRRVRPPSATAVGEATNTGTGTAASAPGGGSGSSGGRSTASAPLATAAGMRNQAAASTGLSSEDVRSVVDEVRRATRGELDRATGQLTAQASDLRGQLEPLLEDYGRRFIRWARRAAIVAVVLYVAYAVVTAQLQTSLLDWIGDRADVLIDQGEGG